MGIEGSEGMNKADVVLCKLKSLLPYLDRKQQQQQSSPHDEDGGIEVGRGGEGEP